MGCIVNGTRRKMADADFGYVGGSPGKVNLTSAKNACAIHIPADQASMPSSTSYREHGKWVANPKPLPSPSANLKIHHR